MKLMRYWWVPFFAFVILVIFLCVYAVTVKWALGDMERRGQFGDLFGAANAFFSGMAMISLLITLWVQRGEIEKRAREMELQVEIMAISSELEVLPVLIRDKVEDLESNHPEKLKIHGVNPLGPRSHLSQRYNDLTSVGLFAPHNERADFIHRHGVSDLESLIGGPLEAQPDHEDYNRFTSALGELVVHRTALETLYSRLAYIRLNRASALNA